MSSADEYLKLKLLSRSGKGNLRSLPSAQAGVDFCSNDYLGIASYGIPGVQHIQGTTGSTGSRLISGNQQLTEETEAQIASFHDAEAALIFNSGYDANLGLLSALGGKDVVFIYDELCHASIIDGIRLSIHRRKSHFGHNDLNDLEAQLRMHSGSGQLFVIVESVYSMDGDLAPLKEIVTLCQRYGAALIVDEAHATGVFGTQGEGLVYELGLQHAVFARVHTFGKALGCHGAAVSGSNVLRGFLVNFARSFIYTTALSPHAIHAVRAVYSWLASAEFSDAALHDNISLFRSLAAAHGAESYSMSPIQVVVIPGNEAVREKAVSLRREGLWVHPVMHPTVPQGTERLRICLHTFNTPEEIKKLTQLIW